jgi:hypothetical protein
MGIMCALYAFPNGHSFPALLSANLSVEMGRSWRMKLVMMEAREDARETVPEVKGTSLVQEETQRAPLSAIKHP